MRTDSALCPAPVYRHGADINSSTSATETAIKPPSPLLNIVRNASFSTVASRQTRRLPLPEKAQYGPPYARLAPVRGLAGGPTIFSRRGAVRREEREQGPSQCTSKQTLNRLQVSWHRDTFALKARYLPQHAYTKSSPLCAIAGKGCRRDLWLSPKEGFFNVSQTPSPHKYSSIQQRFIKSLLGAWPSTGLQGEKGTVPSNPYTAQRRRHQVNHWSQPR